MLQKIVFFNHKGGVSKTTTTFNLGWKLSEKGKRVLLVDADPQCNLTALILNEQFEEYYLNDSTKLQNLKDGVKAAFEGKPQPINAVDCQFHPRSENLFLLPGHANLSEYDAALTFAQTSNNAISTLQNLPGAFNELINKTADRYQIDFVLIDLSPALSAINQNLFTLSDFFIIPTNPDPFSIMALNTLVSILPRWVDWADRMRPSFADAAYPLANTKPRLIGTLIQRFNIRRGKAARPYRENIDEINQTVIDNLVPALRGKDMVYAPEVYRNVGIAETYCLGEIPDFQGLLPKANDLGIPVFAIDESEISETGPVKDGMIQRRDRFNDLFESIAQQVLNLSAHAASI